ncbi:MAG TPA: hypothetical protein VFT87_03670 [Candidatus Saccharimonadales bacterium]|nr:hypothetical protein [Candidatus Saccharimonadales bacterium]
MKTQNRTRKSLTDIDNSWQGWQLEDRTFWVEGYNEESLNKLREFLDEEAGNA